MSNNTSLTFVDAAVVQDHVRDFGQSVTEEALLGFKSAKYLSFEYGIKGSKVLTRFEVVGNMGSNRRRGYASNPDAFKFKPRTIYNYEADFQWDILPSDFEGSYLGKFRKKGQSPDDIPFLTYCMNGSIKKKKTESNQAIWTGVRDEAVKGDSMKIYDGYLTILGKELTANNPLISPVATGLITEADVLDQVEAMWMSLDDAVKEMPLYLHCSLTTALLYYKAWGAKYGTNANEDAGNAIKEVMNVKAVPHAGIKGHELMLALTDNLVFATDSEVDDEKLNVRPHGKGWWYWADYREGVEFRTIDKRYMAINDQIAAV